MPEKYIYNNIYKEIFGVEDPKIALTRELKNLGIKAQVKWILVDEDGYQDGVLSVIFDSEEDRNLYKLIGTMESTFLYDMRLEVKDGQR